MKQPHYRLQVLLDQKARLKQKAEIRLAQTIARLEAEKKRLRRFEEEREAMIAKRKEVRLELHQRVSTGKARIKDGSYGIHYLKRLEEEQKQKEAQIENQKRLILDCETEVKRARRDYINAVKELRIMEKHKELWWKKAQLELLRHEEKEMDELGNIIHQLKKSFQGEDVRRS